MQTSSVYKQNKLEIMFIKGQISDEKNLHSPPLSHSLSSSATCNDKFDTLNIDN